MPRTIFPALTSFLIAFATITPCIGIEKPSTQTSNLSQVYVDMALNKIATSFNNEFSEFDKRRGAYSFQKSSLKNKELMFRLKNLIISANLFDFKKVHIYKKGQKLPERENTAIRITYLIRDSNWNPLHPDNLSKNINLIVAHIIWNKITSSPVFKHGSSYWIQNDIDYLILHQNSITQQGNYYKVIKGKSGKTIKLIGDTSKFSHF